MHSRRTSAMKSARQEDIIRVARNLEDSILRGEMESCSVPKKTAELLGISARTVYKYLKKKPEEIETPGKTRKRKCVGGVGDIDEFTRAHIRRIIYSMTGRGEHLTLNTMLQAIKSSGDPGFEGSRSALYRLLKNEGFAWKKTDGRKVLLEDPRISSLRADFLREYQRLKKEGAVFVFLDETWFFSKGVSPKTWQDGTLYTCKRRNLDQGKRFIVLHAGTEQGFVEGAGIVFAPGTNHGDYHGTMNAESFEKWLGEELLPRLEEPMVIVMDNATYHSVQVEKIPTSNWLKADLCSWLAERGIAHSSHATRKQLYELCKQYRPCKQHRVDNIVYVAGHSVLRLPPYHCQYNPIELVWSDCKRFFYNHTGRGNRFDDEAVQNIWAEALSQVTSEKWKAYVRHTEKLIEEDAHRDLRIDSRINIQPIVIQLDGSSDEDDTSDEEPLAVPLD